MNSPNKVMIEIPEHNGIPDLNATIGKESPEWVTGKVRSTGIDCFGNRCVVFQPAGGSNFSSVWPAPFFETAKHAQLTGNRVSMRFSGQPFQSSIELLRVIDW